MKLTTLLLGFFVSFQIWGTSSLTPLYETARQSFDLEGFEDAQAQYARIRQGGDGHRPEVHFNLGNTLYRQSRYAAALLSFHRAQWLAPADGDIRMNLKMSAKKIQARTPVVPWYRIPASILSTFQWQIAAISLSILFAIYGLAHQLAPSQLRSSSVWVIPLAVLFLAATLLGVWGSSDARFANRGLVVVGEATARFEPSEKATANFSLKAGTEVRLARRQGSWVQIRYEGNRAWLPESSIGQLDWR